SWRDTPPRRAISSAPIQTSSAATLAAARSSCASYSRDRHGVDTARHRRACTSVRRPRRPAAACTACAGIMRRSRCSTTKSEASTADVANRLVPRDRIRVWMDRPGSAKRRPAPHRAGDLNILYEDDDLIAVNKPPGMLAVPLERKAGADSVFDQIDRHLRSHRTRRPLTVHRIDRDTSGVVVFA